MTTAAKPRAGSAMRTDQLASRGLEHTQQLGAHDGQRGHVSQSLDLGGIKRLSSHEASLRP
ncbi:MAG: hypothetical protein V9H69_10445 [Anaerolineae bacterium]